MKWHEAPNRFYVTDEGGQEIAEIRFNYADNHRVIVDHTYVEPHYRGQKIAEKLVDLLVDRLRQEECKMTPACSYVAKRVSKIPDYQDILADDENDV